MKNWIISLTIAAMLFSTLTGCAGSADYTADAGGATENEGVPQAAAEPDYDTADDSIIIRGDTMESHELGQTLQDGSGESYLDIAQNRARSVAEEALVTLSLKVDTAAYSNTARYLQSGMLPPRDAVRTEELINYFPYESPLPFGEDDPFALYTEVGPSPFDEGKKIAFIRMATKPVDRSDLPPSNLTFLIDTSGSMDTHDKLPLLKEAFLLLADTLTDEDRVSIVTYAGSSEILLDSVSGGNKDAIESAIGRLNASGSTAGAQGIQTAYALAEKNFMSEGNNRVILATDGDFNVGVSSVDALADLVGEKRDSGVYLSVLGVGTGNIRDDIMETLAKNGNGNYSYLNNLRAAQKVLVDELAANLFTVADDVKAQVEFNPATVKSYRLIGYENRVMDNRDFADDIKDAGEIGAGADVVVLFELELQGEGDDGARKYGSTEPADDADYADELLEVRIRYKNPGESDSRLVTHPVKTADVSTGLGSSDFRFACSVAAYGELLRGSLQMGSATAADVYSLAEVSVGNDPGGYRREHLDLLERLASLG